MLLYLLRHAEAEPHRADDFSRALTLQGEKQAATVGAFMKTKAILPDLILSSPVLRARQTAEIVAEISGSPSPVVAPWISCGMTSEQALTELADYARLASVLIVGHEPDFSSLLAHLLNAGHRAGVNVSKASLVAIDLPRLAKGSGLLKFLIPVSLI